MSKKNKVMSSSTPKIFNHLGQILFAKVSSTRVNLPNYQTLNELMQVLAKISINFSGSSIILRLNTKQNVRTHYVEHEKPT